MNKKILGVSLAVTFAVIIISSPIMADAITELVKTKIKIDDDEYEKITFKLAEKVPVNGEVFGGYAIFTDGDVIAVTSHQGAYDSEAQDFDNEETTFALCTPEQLAAGLCGPEWHSHLVQPVDHQRCAFKAVGALTFEEPSDETEVKNKKIVLEEIDIETDDFTNSITGTEQDFTAGHPTSPDGVAFDLNAAFDASGNLEAVCIGDVIPLNAPPIISSITLTQNGFELLQPGSITYPIAEIISPVECVANANDADGDPVTLTYEWSTLDGTPIIAGSTLPASPLGNNISVVVTCTVTPYDGIETGPSVSKSACLHNPSQGFGGLCFS